MNKRTLFSLRSIFVLSCLFLLCSNTSQARKKNVGNTTTAVYKESSLVFNKEGVGVLYDVKGKGQIDNIYLVGDMGNWHDPAQCVLNVYCDGELSLSGKLYELAAMCLDFADGDYYNNTYLETPIFTKLGLNNSINLDIKIPYYKSCRVELLQAKPGTEDAMWATVRTSNKINVQYGGIRLPKGAHLKAIRKPNEVVAPGDLYTIMDTDKNSMLVGVVTFIDAEKPQTLEGCMRAFDKRDDSMTYLSSGLEDIFLSTYYFDSGAFLRYKAGITFFNTEKGCQLGAYRIYTDNPICFDHPVRVTIRNGDFRVTDPKAPMNPVMFDPKNATFGSVTYYYEW